MNKEVLENNCVCSFCGKKFHRKPSQINRSNKKNNYCSKECLYEAKKELMKGENNHQYGLKGSKNSSWKSDRYISRYGYMLVRVNDHPFAQKKGWVMEHRLIAEKYLLTEENSIEINGKKYLKPEFIVHHKNGDRLDNRVDNLEIMLKNEHSRMHAKASEHNRNELDGRWVKKTYDYPIVKTKIDKGGAIPRKAHRSDGGWDVRTPIKFTVPAKSSYVLGTKLHLQIPLGYVGFIKSKSGLNVNHDLLCEGVLDSNYNGEIKVKMYNLGDNDYTFEVGDKVTQIVILKVPDVQMLEVEKLDETERGANGFGSSGK